MNFRVDSAEELINSTWREIHPHLKGGFVCALEGPLGSGKTTLVQGIAKKLAVRDHITSPTFNLRKSYPIPRPIGGARFLQHIDLYRLAEATGFDELELGDWLKDNESITFIEWAENIKEAEIAADLVIIIRATGKQRREVELVWK